MEKAKMETKVFEEHSDGGSAQLAVRPEAVQRVLEYADVWDLNQAELTAVVAEVSRVLIQAQGYPANRGAMAVLTVVSDGAGKLGSGRSLLLELDSVATGQVVQQALDLLVRGARPELWEQIRDVMLAPPELLKEWLHAAAQK